MPQVIRWGIVGIGNHADRFLAPAINRAGDSRLVAVASRDIGRAKDFATRHNAETGYDSVATLLGHSGLDAVAVASPNALHKDHTVMAAEAGVHVLCEKPMALTLEDCEVMVEACARQKVKLGVGFHMRYHPGHREARRLISAGVLGAIVLAQAQWGGGIRGLTQAPPRTGLGAWRNDPDLAGAGAMSDRGVHVIDLLRFLTGKEVAEVMAFTDGQTKARPLEDLVTALLRFQDGSLGMLMTSRNTPDPLNDFAVYGSGGRVGGRGTIAVNLGGTVEVVSEKVNTTAAYTSGNMYLDEIEAFNRCLREGGEPEASGLDGIRACQVHLAIFQSACTGRRVRLGTL